MFLIFKKDKFEEDGIDRDWNPEMYETLKEAESNIKPIAYADWLGYRMLNYDEDEDEYNDDTREIEDFMNDYIIIEISLKEERMVKHDTGIQY